MSRYVCCSIGCCNYVLILELGSEIEEVILARGKHADVIYSGVFGDYWSVIVHVPDEVWIDVEWLPMENYPDGVLYMELCRHEDYERSVSCIVFIFSKF